MFASAGLWAWVPALASLPGLSYPQESLVPIGLLHSFGFANFLGLWNLEGNFPEGIGHFSLGTSRHHLVELYNKPGLLEDEGSYYDYDIEKGTVCQRPCSPALIQLPLLPSWSTQFFIPKEFSLVLNLVFLTLVSRSLLGGSF